MVVVSGTGTTRSAIIKMLHALGIHEIYGFNINGIVTAKDYKKYGEQGKFVLQELSLMNNARRERLTLPGVFKRLLECGTKDIINSNCKHSSQN